MKSGIIRSNKGFEIFVDGEWGSFRDVKATASEAIEIFERVTGERVEMFADGRVV